MTVVLLRGALRAWLLVALFAPCAVFAAEPRETADLDAPGPPSLPALAHATPTYTLEYTAARIAPNDVGGTTGDDAFALYAHGALEVPLVPRAWYIGTAHDLASAALPGSGQAFLAGNPEIWGRGIWSSLRGLSSGGGLGIVVPVPRSLSAQEQTALRAVRVVRPWDVAYFDDLTLTFRPWFDIRHIADPIVLQLRQGIDWSVDAAGSDLTARLTFFIGYRALRELNVGLEVWEVYAITSPSVADGRRATFAMSPSVRADLGPATLSLAFLFPIATPLRGDVEDFQAVRIASDFAFDLPRFDP